MFSFSKNKEKNPQNELTMPLLPLRDVVVFPHMIAPLFVGREKSIRALESAMKDDKGIFLATQREAQKDDPAEGDIYPSGTIGQIIQLLRLPDRTVKVLVEERAGERSGNTFPIPIFSWSTWRNCRMSSTKRKW